MRLFGRKKAGHQERRPDPKCTHCGSSDTVVVSHGEDEGNHIRAWRGQRYVVCRCRSCGREFYAEEPPGGADELAADDSMIEDEDALHAAEEELKRRTDEEGDRRYK